MAGSRCMWIAVWSCLAAGCSCGEVSEGGAGDGSTVEGGSPLSDADLFLPDGARRDVGPDLLPGAACRHIDLLISVDPSGSMGEELEAMRADVFPAFASALLAEVGGGLDDFRTATIDSCPRPANFHTRGAGGECGFESGQPWIESTSTDVRGEFACVGDIFTGDVDCSGSNDDEQPASAAATALGEPWISMENAGFIREDALLVVVAITDEDETPVPDATTDEIFDRLVAVKGDVRRMVLLGIGGSMSCSGTYGSADEARDLRIITDRFIAAERGVWWDLCVGRLEDGLTEALRVISQACEELPDLI